MWEQAMAEGSLPALNQLVPAGPNDTEFIKSGSEQHVELIHREDEFEIRRKAFFAV
jgi:hypothetical protein